MNLAVTTIEVQFGAKIYFGKFPSFIMGRNKAISGKMTRYSDIGATCRQDAR